ncbi:hypothetical protein [Methanothrix thermoacetophila]|uniref:Lipoprotein n=1 Tax=Methanothrix thermoacetophila (strain DSM 6194 / JCM 14653 / NBRC 101360 / PT) TaxID=349307 RepID=A0B6Y3_METTP|nr:hypothetical protein [Methanothrix thermoacetophila]ABK14457.1 hypothetical protein Mthe_0667 [Methanothrix thermoacetophila PT]
MKGVVIAAMLIAALLACNLASANPPLPEPKQYEQYCEAQKVAGNGVIDISTSIVDKKIALEYYNVMAGDGDFELDSEHLLSENASRLNRTGPNETKSLPLNLYENSKMTYSGDTPLVGGKYLHSKAFYGGIGAEVQEVFSVTEMEKEQKVFFSSTDPTGHWTANPATGMPWGWKDANNNKKVDPGEIDENLAKAEQYNLKYNVSPTHLVGFETRNYFNGTWGTDSKWHKIFYKDIKDHQSFTGNFEVEKLIKFHEAPFAEEKPSPCQGVDC